MPGVHVVNRGINHFVMVLTRVPIFHQKYLRLRSQRPYGFACASILAIDLSAMERIKKFRQKKDYKTNAL